jgi:carboxyl-terminal processing protease
MPDIFVPRDTSQFSPLYEQLWTNNVLREYALEYYNAERKKLEKMGLSAFVSDFQVSDAMLKVLLDRAKTLGVTYQEAHLNRSEKLIRTILKAYIGKSAFKNEGFFPVLLQEDEIFAQAVKRFPEAENIYKK